MNYSEFFIPCVHFGTCSGCMYQDCTQGPKTFLKAEQFFKELFGMPLVLEKSQSTRWRTRAKLAIQKSKDGKIVIGLYQKASHIAMAIPFCQVHHDKINEAVKLVQDFLSAHNCNIYNENTHTGDLRYIQLIVERRTQKVQLSFILNISPQDSHKNALWEKYAHKIYKEHSDLWHSIWINYQSQKTNTIIGKEWKHIIGNELIWEEISAKEFAFGPSHFGQANLEMFEMLLLDLQSWITPGLSITELYGGIGIIGISLLDISKKVRITELESSCEKYFLYAKERLPNDLQEKVHYSIEKAEKSQKALEVADVVVVDPPRKGLSPKLIQEILDSKTVRELIYISCNWESFERDCKVILQDPRWKLDKARAYLFFPGTDHIETLTLFKKKTF